MAVEVAVETAVEFQNGSRKAPHRYKQQLLKIQSQQLNFSTIL